MKLIATYIIWSLISFTFSTLIFTEASQLEYASNLYHNRVDSNALLIDKIIFGSRSSVFSYQDLELLIDCLAIDNSLTENSHVLLKDMATLYQLCYLNTSFYEIYGEWIRSLVDFNDPLSLNHLDLKLYSFLVQTQDS